MSAFRGLLNRFAGMFTGVRRDPDMLAEFESHVQMETDENIRRGMTPDEARRQAILASGGLAMASEAVRDQRGLPRFESLLADFRYAFRGLRRSPGFTLIVVLTLALGIGANTAIFSVVRGVILKPLPHRDGQQLVFLRQSADGSAFGASTNFSVTEVRELRAGAPTLSGGVAEFSSSQFVLRGEADAVRVTAGLVTGNFFEVMGLSPILGRLTRPADDGPGVPPVMVLTHAYWMRRFGGDSGIVGKQVRVDGGSVTVIGVLEPAPSFPDRNDVLMNMVVSPHHLSSQMQDIRDHRMTRVVARLAPSASLAQTRSEVARVYDTMKRDHPAVYNAASNFQVAVIPFREAMGERAGQTLWILMFTAAFVMIIAAANVANLTLMRGVRREHELVVRASLGAGVARLRRLLLAENLLLSFLGAGAGIALAVGGLPLLVGLASRFSPRASEIGLDWTVLAFTLGLSVVVALVFSFVAFLPSDTMLASVSAGGRRSSGGVRRQRLQRGLVVVQVAISVVLLAGAGLLTRTMLRLSEVDTGLSSEEVLTMQVDLLTQTQILRDPSAMGAARERYDRIRDEIAALPGITRVGIGSTMPLRAGMSTDLRIEGKVPAAGTPAPAAELRLANADYFDAAGIPVVRGRVFDGSDRQGSEKVVVVNQEFADRHFPGENAIGRRIGVTGLIVRFGAFTEEWRTIVGVVGNTQDGGLDTKPRAVFFMPFAQELALSGGFVIRADTNVARFVSAATRIVRASAPGTPVENVMTVRQYKSQSVAPRRLNATLISSFGILAVIIAAVGIAGVLAFSVSARTNEIGIRMSLGAGRWQVERMILREGGTLLVGGLLVGLGGAFFAGRAIKGLLFGVEPNDPVTLVTVAAAMAAIGFVAIWIPALRAARVDPAITMRS